MNSEGKRNHPRIEIEAFVSYVVLDRHRNIMGQGIGKVVNLSRGGILLETHEQIEAPYTLLSLTDETKKNFSFLGQVAHSEARTGGKFHTGIRFVEKEAKTREVVTRLVKFHSRQKNI